MIKMVNIIPTIKAIRTIATVTNAVFQTFFKFPASLRPQLNQ
jgi:hypothetical protein